MAKAIPAMSVIEETQKQEDQESPVSAPAEVPEVKPAEVKPKGTLLTNGTTYIEHF